MALQHLPQELHRLPIEVQEMIWGFGFHLKLATIHSFHREERVVARHTQGYTLVEKMHYIWRLAVNFSDLPNGMDHYVYWAVVGIPAGFFCDFDRPRVSVTPPPREKMVLPPGTALDLSWNITWQYDTVAGIETYAEVLTEYGGSDRPGHM